MGIKFNALTGKLDLSAGSTLPTESGIPSYTSADLPWSAAQGQQAFNTTIGAPVYFSNGDWKKYSDDSVVLNRTIDIFILAGQSNAHGHADVADLSSAQATQTGLFYTSWHNDTINAESTQHFGGLAEQLVAGSTRGDLGVSSLGGSLYFGPELGFVSRANAINLTGNTIGVLKYAVGASALNAGTAWSDWDTTATGYREGDCWRGLQAAIADCVSKLDAAGYDYNFKGLIWWQGESGATVAGLQTFITALRSLMGTTYGVANSSQFPVVITKIGYTTPDIADLTPVADADPYVGIVDAGAYGQTASQNHLGASSDVSSDTNSNGVNDMFEIGEAYADQMQLAISGSTIPTFNPLTLSPTLWFDADDASTITTSGSAVTAWNDKSGNNDHPTILTNVTQSGTIGGRNAMTFNNSSIMTGGSAGWGWQETFIVAEYTGGSTFPVYEGLFTGGVRYQIVLLGHAGTNHFYNFTVTPINQLNVNGTASSWSTGSTLDIITALSGGGIVGINSGSAASLTGWTIGQQSDFTDRGWTGKIAEVLTFSTALSSADREKVEGYLAHKWALAWKLPAGHPYKTSAP